MIKKKQQTVWLVVLGTLLALPWQGMAQSTLGTSQKPVQQTVKTSGQPRQIWLNTDIMVGMLDKGGAREMEDAMALMMALRG
ncbi:MAG: hypothetical protein EOO39_11450 [Cytophagaceae bacterium]|nr:MAG: hypothetical protein EOO39_11450 [Cytophagaceae bacterium]